jgi:hypothetical protein
MVDDLAGGLQLPEPMRNPTLVRNDDRDKGGEDVLERKRSQAKVG